jgi:hypothetical protein
MIGTKLGPYQILDKLGEGGMGEVYRAHDSKLGRDVALKILPPAFTSNPDRLARFEREARLLASLNHPHVGAIYGLEEAGGVRALVLELIEGPTLAERMAAGPISTPDALEIVRQIAEALEAAHEKGIVHRDLKPANIKIAPNGSVKVLDFGVAKATAHDSVDGALSSAPTATMEATAHGVIVGTAAYMSPEQARGQPVDKRTDVWAFGCVLYEMLAGRRAFTGDTASDVLARVIERDPDWAALPAALPEPIRRLLERSLRKDRHRRLSDIADARIEIDDALAAPVLHDRAAVAGGTGRRSVLWGSAALVLVLALGAAGFFLLRPAAAVSPVRLSATIPPGMKFQVGGGALGAPAGNGGYISPDGRKLLFTLVDGTGKWQMWMRAIDSGAAQPLAGTELANSPFWSADGRYVGFFDDSARKLKKLDVTTGSVTTICDAPGGRGGSWSRDNIIVFARSNTEGLFKVPAAGGEPLPATTLRAGEAWHRSPSFLPDGRHFLYRVNGVSPGVFLGSLDSLEGVRLLDADSNAIYAPPGYVLFTRQAMLLAQAFDDVALRLAGEPVPVAEDVHTDLVNGLSAFSVSDNGVLTYRKGGIRSVNFQLTWFNREGKPVESVGSAAPYRGVDLAPDGMRAAIHRHDAVGGDLWILERARGTMSRFTFDPAQDNSAAVWSHDGTRVAYSSIRGGKWGLYQKPSNGSGAEEPLLESDVRVAPDAWSRDGSSLVYETIGPETASDLMLLPLGTRTPSPLVRTKFFETAAQISPDGNWLAYQSDESGNPEIYVDAFPQGGAKLKVSTEGGATPRWRGDSRELFYTRSTLNSLRMVAASLKVNGPTLEAGSPAQLFEFPYLGVTHPSQYRTYDVSADGQRFLVLRLAAEEVGTTVEVVLNWNAALPK